MSQIENIIFDLGNVLYRVDFKKVLDAIDHKIVLTKEIQEGFLDLFERGEMSEAAFRNEFRKQSQMHTIPDNELDIIWNSMLLGPIEDRQDILKALHGRYNLILLSNTNSIHTRHFTLQCNHLFQYFSKLYYSFEMGKRKPEPRIFEQVLSETGFDPSITLFVDDGKQHIESAQKLGIKTLHLPVAESLKTDLESILA